MQRLSAQTRTTLLRVLGSAVPLVFGFWLAQQLPLDRGFFSVMVPVAILAGLVLRSWWSVGVVPAMAFGGFALAISLNRGWGGVWQVVPFPVLVALLVALFSPSAGGALIGTWIGKLLRQRWAVSATRWW